MHQRNGEHGSKTRSKSFLQVKQDLREQPDPVNRATPVQIWQKTLYRMPPGHVAAFHSQVAQEEVVMCIYVNNLLVIIVVIVICC